MENYYRFRIAAWSTFIIAALFYAYEYVLRILPSLITTELAHHFDIVAIQLGHLAAFYYYAYTFMQIPAGILLDRFNPIKVLKGACLICVIGIVGFSHAQQLWVAEVSRFLMGFGSAFAFVGTLKVITLYLPKRYFCFFSRGYFYLWIISRHRWKCFTSDVNQLLWLASCIKQFNHYWNPDFGITAIKWKFSNAII